MFLIQKSLNVTPKNASQVIKKSFIFQIESQVLKQKSFEKNENNFFSDHKKCLLYFATKNNKDISKLPLVTIFVG